MPQDQTILVLGKDTRYYLQNKPATPYLNWQLAQRDFGNLNKYDAIYNIYLNLRTEMPAFIIDEAGLMQELKYKLPAIFEKYSPTGQNNIYVLKQ